MLDQNDQGMPLVRHYRIFYNKVCCRLPYILEYDITEVRIRGYIQVVLLVERVQMRNWKRFQRSPNENCSVISQLHVPWVSEVSSGQI